MSKRKNNHPWKSAAVLKSLGFRPGTVKNAAGYPVRGWIKDNAFFASRREAWESAQPKTADISTAEAEAEIENAPAE